jgi:uncharacterized membrane protein
MAHPATTRPLDRSRLVETLERLRQDGTLSPAQVTRVLDALDDGNDTPSGGLRTSRLVEAAAYAGGVLVAAAGLLLVGQRWEELGRPGRVAVLAGVTLALTAVGVVVGPQRPPGRAPHQHPAPPTRRRLAGTVLSGAAVSAAGTVALLDPDRPVPAAVTAVLLMAVVQWAAPGVVPESVALGSVLYLTGSVLDLDHAQWSAVVVSFALVGTAWAAAAGTRLFSAPVPATALGLAVVLLSGVMALGWESASRPYGITILALLAVVGLGAFVRGGRWPLAAAGAAALAAIVLDTSSESLGPAVGIMLSGVLLLVLALGMVLVRRRRSGPTG